MKRRLWRLALGGGVAAVAVICSLACGAGDKPTQPPQPPPVDYPVYGYDLGQTGKLFRYHPITGVIDSLDCPWRAKEGVTVSADGSRFQTSRGGLEMRQRCHIVAANPQTGLDRTVPLHLVGKKEGYHCLAGGSHGEIHQEVGAGRLGCCHSGDLCS